MTQLELFYLSDLAQEVVGQKYDGRLLAPLGDRIYFSYALVHRAKCLALKYRWLFLQQFRQRDRLHFWFLQWCGKQYYFG